MKCRFTLILISFIAANVALAANPAGPIHWETAENVQTGVKLVRIETTSTKLAEMRAKNPARYGHVAKDPAAKAGKQDKKNDKAASPEPERLLKAYVAINLGLCIMKPHPGGVGSRPQQGNSPQGECHGFRTALVYDGHLSPGVEADRFFDFIIPAEKLFG